MNNSLDSDMSSYSSSSSFARQDFPTHNTFCDEFCDETYFLLVDIGNTAVGCALTTTPLLLGDKIPLDDTAISTMQFKEIRFSTAHILQHLTKPSLDNKKNSNINANTSFIDTNFPSVNSKTSPEVITNEESVEKYLYNEIESFITQTLTAQSSIMPSPSLHYNEHTDTSLANTSFDTPSNTVPTVSATTAPTITLVFTFSSVVPRLSPIIESVLFSLKKHYSNLPKNTVFPYSISNKTASLDIYRAHYRYAQDLGLHISIPHPEIIGEDLLTDCVGALPLLKNSHTGILIIDFGTATKYLLLSPAGEFVSAVIAPGIETSILSLSNSATQLPPLTTSFISTFFSQTSANTQNLTDTHHTASSTAACPLSHLPSTTQEAMEVGIYNYIYGGITETIRYFKKLTHYPLKIITSGGQGCDISLALKDNALYDIYLPYRGLIRMTLPSLNVSVHTS